MSHHARLVGEQHVHGATPYLFAARDELASLDESLCEFAVAGFKFRVYHQHQSLWVVVEWPEGGLVATRPAYIPVPGYRLTELVTKQDSAQLSLECAIGVFHVLIELPQRNVPLLHSRTTLAPKEDLTIADWQCDLYPLDKSYDPLGAAGVVHTAQKGPTGAMLYATIHRPWKGSLLYFQNLTALNTYFEQTRTKPLDRVSHRWPELGFMLPPSLDHPIPAGQDTVIGDAYLLLSPQSPEDKVRAARLFLDLYAELYLALPKPDPEFRDWPRRVDSTVRDLTHSPVCGIHKNERRYLLAYVGADDRPPKSMVQLAVLLPLLEYAQWLNEDIPIAERLRENLPTFFNPDVKTVMRWLPGEKIESNEEHMGHEIMDAWYLYHTYLNISRLAEGGDEIARQLLVNSIDYGISVAHHFSYRWPVFYDVQSLDIVKPETKPAAGGEHDVGAQYVHLMMQMHDLTGEQRFMEEAERAAQTLDGLGFDMGYQFNNTSFGAGGFLRLWKATGNELYRDLSYVCLANVVQNFWLWECDYGHAKNYHTFLGLVPLRDSVYLAIYEELEVLAAFHEYLSIAGDDAPSSVRVLLCEYSKYLIDRAWYYYPEELPAAAIVEKPKSGHINRNLAIPLEDIYEGWEQAGKVGQEVYGAAAPFVFSTRHFHRIEGVNFRIYCDYPVFDFATQRGSGKARTQSGKATFHIAGDRRCRAHVRIIPDDYTPLPNLTLKARHGRTRREVKGTVNEIGYWEYELPGNAEVIVAWHSTGRRHGNNRHQRNGRHRGRQKRGAAAK